MIDQANLTVIEAPASLPFDRHRTYMMLSSENGGEGLTVSINGLAVVELAEGEYFQFLLAPLNAMDITGTGVITYSGSNYE